MGGGRVTPSVNLYLLRPILSTPLPLLSLTHTHTSKTLIILRTRERESNKKYIGEIAGNQGAPVIAAVISLSPWLTNKLLQI